MTELVAFDPADSAVGQTVMAAGLRTHYIEAGGGEPLVLLHGSGPGVSGWENWAGVIPALAAQRRVLAPDIPGFGATQFKPDGDYNMGFWVDHLFAFMSAVGATEAPIVGNSFGGMVAMEAAVRDPSRVERLVLMGTPAGDVPLSAAHKASAAYRTEPSPEAMERILRFFPYDQSLVTPEMVENRYRATLRPGAREASGKVVKIVPASDGSDDAIMKAMPEATLQTIQTPTLIVHGRDDLVIPFDIALRLHRAIKPSQLHSFGNCGHWVQIERREKFAAQVLEFVGQ